MLTINRVTIPFGWNCPKCAQALRPNDVRATNTDFTAPSALDCVFETICLNCHRALFKIEASVNDDD
jgi:hypothetical protein